MIWIKPARLCRPQIRSCWVNKLFYCDGVRLPVLLWRCVTSCFIVTMCDFLSLQMLYPSRVWRGNICSCRCSCLYRNNKLIRSKPSSLSRHSDVRWLITPSWMIPFLKRVLRFGDVFCQTIWRALVEPRWTDQSVELLHRSINLMMPFIWQGVNCLFQSAESQAKHSGTAIFQIPQVTILPETQEHRCSHGSCLTFTQLTFTHDQSLIPDQYSQVIYLYF